MQQVFAGGGAGFGGGGGGVGGNGLMMLPLAFLPRACPRSLAARVREPLVRGVCSVPLSRAFSHVCAAAAAAAATVDVGGAGGGGLGYFGGGFGGGGAGAGDVGLDALLHRLMQADPNRVRVSARCACTEGGVDFCVRACVRVLVHVFASVCVNECAPV